MRSRNSKLLPVLRAMDAFTAPHTPDGYEVIYDASMNLYYPVQKATAGRGHARPGWDYINDPDDRGHACFELRDDAVEFCIRHSQHQPAEPQPECALADHLIDGGDIPDEVWANWAYADDDDAEYDGRHGPWPGEK